MSLDKKKQETKKRISIVGSETDMNVMRDAISQTKRMFNVDIDKKNKSLPMRISISEETEPEATTYPRVAQALARLETQLEKKIPETDESHVVNVNISARDWIYHDPRSANEAPISVRVLQSITEGVARHGLRAITPTKHYAGRDIMHEFDQMFEGKPNFPENMTEKHGFFATLSPEWVYIQTADVHPTTTKIVENRKDGEDIRKLRKLEEERLGNRAAYYPDLGVIKSSKGKNVEATQAYAVVFRGDVEFDMNQKINLDVKRWSNFVKRLPDGLISKELTANKPKTVEDFLKVFFSYNVASFMKMQDTTVRPIGPNRTAISTEHMIGEERESLTIPFANRKLGEKILYSALVVGTGTYRPGFHDIVNIEENHIPGWN